MMTSRNKSSTVSFQREFLVQKFPCLYLPLSTSILISAPGLGVLRLTGFVSAMTILRPGTNF